ncbi:hypothetical protein ACFE04_009314 [Oxalis oulophora]
MGAVCCCLRPEDFEDYMNPNSSVYRNNMCLSCFLHNFLHVTITAKFNQQAHGNLIGLQCGLERSFWYLLSMSLDAILFYTSLFQRGELHSIPSSLQGTASMTSISSLDNSLADIYRSPPRPLPYDTDPRYFRSQRDGLVSRREKGSSHSHDESEPLRGDNDDANSETMSIGEKWNDSNREEGSKEQHSRSSLKISSAKATAGLGHTYFSSEEEDVCPTCLDEYTPENPKIITKCSHHFHLGCIYEWMERSENCPICDKFGIVDEKPERTGENKVETTCRVSLVNTVSVVHMK